jgi:hypothetical protein
MNRFLKLAATLSFWEFCGRHPAMATMLLLGVGGAGVAALNTPTITPQPSLAFSQSNSYGYVNAALKTNGGSVGAFEVPSTSTNSFAIYHEFTIDPNIAGLNKFLLGGGASNGGISFTESGFGSPSIIAQETSTGTAAKTFQWWLPTVGYSNGITNPLSFTHGTNYNAGFYAFTASDGCPTVNGAGAREPTGVALTATSAWTVDPGFLCGENSSGRAPQVAFASIPGIGASQTPNATTCASNTPATGQIAVTFTTPVAHGLSPGQQFVAAGYTTTAINGSYTAIAGTGGVTLVGTNASTGTCPGSITIGSGTVASGSGGSLAIAAPSPTAPYTTQDGTGVQTVQGQRVCAVYGEFGADSNFPGAQFYYATDYTGTALPGSPAISPWLNQGATNFTGYTVTGAQSAGNPALTVTAMNSYSVSAASYSTITGLVTFTTAASGFVVGSEFTISGLSPSGFNQTYVAVAGTSGTTVVGNPLSGPIGVPQPNNPGATSSTGTGAMVGVIMPGMMVAGSTNYSIISPFGTFGSTGTGGTGTYGLTTTQATFSITASFATSVMTVTGTPLQQIVVGTGITGTGVPANTVVTSLGTGTGGAGTYNLSTAPGTISPQTNTGSGSIGSSGSPVSIYAAPGFYYNIAPSTAAGGGSLTTHTQTSIADLINVFGAPNATTLSGNSAQGWGGMLANVGMFYGVFPNANGTPSSAAMGQICGKTLDFQTWASTYGGSWHSHYPLNDGGIWADDSVADFTGSISGTALTVTSTQTGSTSSMGAGTVIAGSGITGCPSVCPTISSGSGSSYTLNTSGGTVSTEPMTAGAFKPAVPLGTSSFNGEISGSTLTVNSVTNNASFTGALSGPAGASCTVTHGAPCNTLTVSGVTGTIAIGQCVSDGGVSLSPQYPLCISAGSGTTWTVTNSENYYGGISAESMTSTATAIVPGQFIQGAGITTPIQVLGYGSGNGGVGTYPLSSSANGTIASETMTSSGLSAGGAIAPGAALTVDSPGSGATYPITNFSANLGAMQFTGTYNTGLLGGVPAHIQAQVSATPQGPPLSGCSACAWTNVSSETISGGAWSGSVVAIPAGGPYWVSLRASNGTAYATLPNAVFVGVNVASFGEGNSAAQLQGAFNQQTYFSGISSLVGAPVGGLGTPNIVNGSMVPGPPILGLFTDGVPGQLVCDRFGVVGTAASCMQDGGAWLAQNASAQLGGAPVGRVDLLFNGSESQNIFFDGVPQTQTIGVGDGSTAHFSSGPMFGGSTGNSSVSGSTVTVTASIATTGVMTVTVAGSNPLRSNWSVLNIGQSVVGTGYSGFITGFASGTGGTGTYTVSPAPGSSVTSRSFTVTGNNLEFNSALAVGATINGTVASNVLTLNSLSAGAVAPLMTISDGANSATVTACLTLCSPFSKAGSTWQLSSGIPNETAALTLTPPGGALYVVTTPYPPNIPYQTAAPTTGTNPIIEVGTFRILVNGSVVCTDSSTFAYNQQTGNCVGAGISSAWVNYGTGAYDVVFSPAPANGATIVAEWTNISSRDNSGANEQIPWVGGTSATSGMLASVAARSGGINAYLNGAQGAITNGWPLAYLDYTHQNNWFFGTKMASLHNGQANQPMLTTGQWRGLGSLAYLDYFAFNPNYDNEQWGQDAATRSEFSGTISGSSGTSPSTALLTLSAASTGPMWEGEVIECNPYSASCALPVGTELVSLASGTWGASGSTYNLTLAVGAFSNIGSSFAIHNAMFYTPGNAVYVGPFNDLSMQGSGTFIGGYQVETGGGVTGALRYGHRVGVESGAGLSGNLSKGENPTISRTSFTGCDASAGGTSPCFDVASTYSASNAATWSGSTFTITGGLSAGSRPFVPGMALSCSGCNPGLVALSVSLPPTQSTATGAGQVGQTFTITASGAIGGGGSGTVTGGCSGTPGTGSNCIDFNFNINTTGTYRTIPALNNCGANNLLGTNSNSPYTGTYIYPNGACVPTGVGAIVRGFRIGTAQITDNYGNPGSPYDFGADPGAAGGSNGNGGQVTQNSAFACNIVAATVVQCVKGPTYSRGIFSAIGQWLSGATYVSFGDPNAAFSAESGIIGYPGGQSFPFTAGSGYTNGNYVTGGVCTLGTAAGSVAQPPAMGFNVSGGAIVNAYPTQIGSGALAACTFPLSFTGTASISGSSGTNANLVVTAVSGGTMAAGETVMLGAQTLTVKPLAVSNTGGAATYAVTCATTCSNAGSTSFTVNNGMTGGTGGSITTPPLSPTEGVGGIATVDTDSNMSGMGLYDNSGVSGNPLAGSFAIPSGGSESPGLPVRPFGMRRGYLVSG